MGIDIYARWKGITEEEKDAQYTGYSVIAGNVGYLREAYHGGPYATKELVKEAFESDTGKAPIEAKVLRERLPKVLETVAIRAKNIYNSSEEDIEEVQKSFSDFVELCERKEEETGEPCTVVASY